MKTFKPCATCKFHRHGLYGHDCARKETTAEVPDLIYGGTKFVDTSPLSAYRTAESERTSILPWKCGKEARHHEPKVPA